MVTDSQKEQANVLLRQALQKAKISNCDKSALIAPLQGTIFCAKEKNGEIVLEAASADMEGGRMHSLVYLSEIAVRIAERFKKDSEIVETLTALITQLKTSLSTILYDAHQDLLTRQKNLINKRLKREGQKALDLAFTPEDTIAKIDKYRQETRKQLRQEKGRGGANDGNQPKWNDTQIKAFIDKVDGLPTIKHNGKIKALWQYAIDILEEHDYEKRGLDILQQMSEFAEVKELLSRLVKERKPLFSESKKIPEHLSPKAYLFRHAQLLLSLPEVGFSSMKRYYGKKNS